MSRPQCTIAGCDRPVSSRTWCQAHYTRWRRHGDPLVGRTKHLMSDRRSHGMTDTPEYVSWMRMRRRCDGSENREHYFDRGIKVCARWVDSFENFYADMGPRPSPRHSVDRINNDGNYEPGNCRWALPVIQANNRSSNRLVEFKGDTLSLRQALRKAGDVVAKDTALRRLNRGWAVVAAITTPPDSRFNNRRSVE